MIGGLDDEEGTRTSNADVNSQIPQQQQQQQSMEIQSKSDEIAAEVERMKKRLEGLTAMDCYALCGFFSLAEMVPAIQLYTGSNYCASSGCATSYAGYAVALGAVSLFICLIAVTMHNCGRTPPQKSIQFLSAFLFLWWLCGVIVVTFFNPFTLSGGGQANGYFCSWFAAVTCSIGAQRSGQLYTERLDKKVKELEDQEKPAFYLFLSSCVVTGASISPCMGTCVGINAYTVALGSVSAGEALIITLWGKRLPKRAILWMVRFLIVWWVVGVVICTFSATSNFAQIGNGYFGCYVSLFLTGVVSRSVMNT